MYKLQTRFSYFKYGNNIQDQPLLVTWFKLDETNVGKCFSYKELKQFSDYIISHPVSFEILIDFECNDNSANFTYNRIILDKSIPIPHSFVLKMNPKVYKTENVFECMDVVLINMDKKDDHDYNLAFDVIGDAES
jgi:hypothetical protein